MASTSFSSTNFPKSRLEAAAVQRRESPTPGGIAGDVLGNRSADRHTIQSFPEVNHEALHARVETDVNSIQLNGQTFEGDETEKLKAFDKKMVVMNVTEADTEGKYAVGEHEGFFDYWGNAEDGTYAYFAVGEGPVISTDKIIATITPVS